MAGAHPKPKALRVDNRPQSIDVGPLTAIEGREVPKPSKEWSKAVTEEWVAYWQSPVASLVSAESDVSAVRRLFDYRDEHARAMRAYRKERVSIGSQGQAVLSPMAKMVAQLERLILPLEDRFGLSAISRLKLGAELGTTHSSLAALNDAFSEKHDDEDEDTEAEVVDLPGVPRTS